jgi:hypothetical protein
MRRSIRSAAAATAVTVGLVLGLSACGDAGEAVKEKAVDQVDKAVDETYEVTYEVTGTGIESIQYATGEGTATNPRMETVGKPRLPWKKTVTLRGIMPSSVLPLGFDPAGAAEVGCRIIHKGKVIAEQSGKGLATAGGCVGMSPVAG